MVLHLCVITLLAISASAESSDSIFGFPTNCRPSLDCHVVFRFDQQGNLDLEIQNLTDSSGYVAVAVDKLPDDSTEYLLCIPHQQKRLRAVAGIGEAIRVTEEKMARYVSHPSENNFVCSFLSTELPADFHSSGRFFFSEGKFSEDLVIAPGFLMTPVVPEDVDVFSHPIAASRTSSDDDDGVLTSDERKMTSDLLKNLERISKKKDDDLEDQKSEDDDSEEEFDDDLDDLMKKKYSTHHRQNRRRGEESRRRPVKKDEDVEEEEETDSEEVDLYTPRRGRRPTQKDIEDVTRDFEEDEDDEDEDVPKKKKKSKRPFRHDDSEEEDDDDEDRDSKRRNKGKKKNQKKDDKKKKSADEDDYYNDDDDEEENGSNGYGWMLPTMTLVLFRIIV